MDDLNKALAEALGWRDVREYPAHPGKLWGVPSYVEVQGDEDIDLAMELIPDFYDSVDATLATLPEGCKVSIQMVVLGGAYHAHIAKWMSSLGWTGTGATRAEALANAALEWAQAENGSGAENGGG